MRRCDCGKAYDRCSQCDYDKHDEYERRESTWTMLFAIALIVLITFVIPVILIRVG